MYNGIGLATVRGSATSGHISKNLSYIKPEFFRNKLDANLSGGRQSDAQRGKGGANYKVNKDVLEHNRKHALEAQVFEFEDSLREKGGYTEEEIEEKVTEFRANLVQRQTARSTENYRNGRATDTHEISARKNEENERLRAAFGIGKDFVSGASFDPVMQEQRRKDREAEKAARFEQNKLDRERREKEQLERRKIHDQMRENRASSDDRRGEKRNREDSRDRSRNMGRNRGDRDRDSRERGRSRYERRGRSNSRSRDRDERRDRRRDDSRSRSPSRNNNRSDSTEKDVVPSNASARRSESVAEEGEVSSPYAAKAIRERSRSRSASPEQRRRNRSESREDRHRGRGRERSPASRGSDRRRSRSYSSSSSSSSGSSGSSSSSSRSSSSRSSSSDRSRERGRKASRRRSRSRS